MLYNIVLALGAWLMLSLIVAIFVGHAIYRADIEEGTYDDEC